MARFAEHGPVDRPGACKWCGRKLRRPQRSTWEYLRAKSCKDCGSENLKHYGDVSEDRRTYISHECQDCYTHGYGPRRLVSRTPVYPKPGDYGDGHFCGQTCGFNFAVRVADLGTLLVLPTPTEST